MGKFKTFEQTVTRVDENGEIIEESVSKSWTINKKSEPFFLTYINSISWIYGLKSVTTIKILYKLLEKANYNTNKVDISTKFRKNICDSLEISQVSFTKSLKTLIDLNILKELDDAYEIAPEFFWKGDYKTREALMKSSVKITIEPNMDFESDFK